MVSSSITTLFVFDLALLIYSNFIINHLKSDTNLKMSVYKNFFLKFYYLQLISFFDTALLAQPHSYKTLYLVICFLFVSLNFNELLYK